VISRDQLFDIVFQELTQRNYWTHRRCE